MTSLSVSRLGVIVVMVARRRLVVAGRLVVRRLDQVGVVEVQAARLPVIGRLVDVRRTGNGDERNVSGTAAECEESTHLAESNRLSRSAAMDQPGTATRLVGS